MRIKFIQYFIGNNQKYLKLSKICEEINKKYCQLHGYEYECQYKTWQDAKNEGFEYNDSIGGNVGMYKMFYLHKILEKRQNYDYYIFLDADAAVSKPIIKIEDLIDDTHQFYVAHGNDRFGQYWALKSLYEVLRQKLESTDFLHTSVQKICKFEDGVHNLCQHLSMNIIFNEGFLIIKNTETMKDFFYDCYQYSKYRSNTIRPILGGGLDGNSMSHMLLLQKYNPLYIHMYSQAQGCRASSYEFKYDVEKTFILHNYGDAMTAEQKIEDMKQVKNNKWWKEILKKENI